MTGAETQPPRQPGKPALAVQPPEQAVDGLSPVPTGWVQDFEQSEASRRLEVLTADQDLVTRLGLQGYEGREYEIFRTELAKYGLDVITGWLIRAVIFAKCKERGFGGLPPPPPDAFSDRDPSRSSWSR